MNIGWLIEYTNQLIYGQDGEKNDLNNIKYNAK